MSPVKWNWSYENLQYHENNAQPLNLPGFIYNYFLYIIWNASWLVCISVLAYPQMVQ